MPSAGAKGSSPCRFTTIVSSLQPAMRAHSARRSVPDGCAVDVIATRTPLLQGLGDALVIGGNPDFARACRQRTARDMQDQRLAGEQAQGLARQARGGVAGRNGDDEVGCWIHLGYSPLSWSLRQRCDGKHYPFVARTLSSNATQNASGNSARTGTLK
jgi:hypothetical protein